MTRNSNRFNGIGTLSTTYASDNITTIMHPDYRRYLEDRIKWRLTYHGGDPFIRHYLMRFEKQEDQLEHRERLRLAYCPAFAKTAVQEVRNAIYKRACDITRAGGSKTYQAAINGEGTGVDRHGSDMNLFMGVKVLDELLPMRVVGIYVDMPEDVGSTLLDRQGKRPYVYVYQAESIRSYTPDPEFGPDEYSSVLLTDHDYVNDEATGLPTGQVETFRHMYVKIEPDGRRQVYVQFYDEKGDIAPNGEERPVGKLQRIPFILLDLGNSLLEDVANYQIALMNLASSDIWYSVRANFPFYTEQFDQRSDSPYVKTQTSDDSFAALVGNNVAHAGANTQITLGPLRGRRYPIGANQPAFIHPSTDPMMASMKKQEQIKLEIRELVHLGVQNLGKGDSPNPATLQDGLGFIALILQYAENQIAKFWALYEGNGEVATINYPEQFSLLSQEQIDLQVKSLEELLENTTSLLLKKKCMQLIANIRIGTSVTRNELVDIYDEIEEAKVISGNPKNITADLLSGIVSLKTASVARGYPDDEAEKAANDHTERLARVQAAQTPAPDGQQHTVDPKTAQARGLPDFSNNPNASIQEKAVAGDPTFSDKPQDVTRGAAV